MALTARCALLALFGVAIVLIHPARGLTVAVIDGAIVLAVLTDIALAPSPRAVEFRRSGDRIGRLGEPVTVRLTIGNASRRTLRAIVRDAWPPSAASRPRSQRVQIPPADRRVIETTLVPTRRGDRQAAEVTVRSIGPLGLAGRQARHRVPWVVRVLPEFASRRYLPERLSRLRDIEGRVAVRGPGQGTEFDALRDYVTGDDPRAIDWRATARRSAVVVRTYRPERDRRVLLVIDTGRTSAGRIGDATRLDASLDAALLVGALAARAGDNLELLAFDRVVRAGIRARDRGAVLQTLGNAMANLEPHLVETDARGLVSEILRRARRRSLVILFTALEPAALEEGLLPALTPLTQRHTVIAAGVADPRLDELASGRSDAAAVYASAAAEGFRSDRLRIATLLHRRGVDVVDAPPESFAPRVADAYLAMKAAGRL